MRLEAWPQNDSLKRWRIVDLDSPGRGKQVIAENIRSELIARSLCHRFNVYAGPVQPPVPPCA